MKMQRYERQKALRKAGYKTLTLDGHGITRQTHGGWWIEKPGETLWNAKDAPGRNGATGYYCNDAFETYVPAVIRMGQRLFAGYLEPWNDGLRAGPDTFTPDDLDAAKREADRYTERAAEEAFEYDERWQAARRIEEEITDLETERAAAYAEAHAWLAEMRKSALSPGLCDRLRIMIRDKVERARECLREIAPLREMLAEYRDVAA